MNGWHTSSITSCSSITYLVLLLLHQLVLAPRPLRPPSARGPGPRCQRVALPALLRLGKGFGLGLGGEVRNKPGQSM